MRPILPLLSLAPLIACAAAEAPVPDLQSRQEAACTAAIAVHIGRSPVEVTSRWISSADGVANIEARDGNRLHLCSVDASARILGYTHPRH